MRNELNLWVAGGDMRQAKLAELLAADGHTVHAYALERLGALDGVEMKAADLRVQEDLRGEKINYKIRELSLQKIPYIAVVGDKEMQTNTVSIRARGGKNLGVMPVDAFIERVLDEDRRRVIETEEAK